MSTSTETPSADLAVTEEKPALTLDVKVESPSACLRDVLVTIPNADVKRYLKDAYDELVPEAQVPGFRSGRAPRKLVEKQFKDRVQEQVKGSLLMDSLGQVTESQDFSAIGEPDFDYEAIKLDEDADFKFQFKIEVRPEFKTPKWEGIKLAKPVEEISDADVDEALKRVLSRYATLEATDEAAEAGDKLLITAKFKLDGKQLSEMDEERVTIEDRLSFSDAYCEDFGKLMAGVKEGETRKGKAVVAEGVDNEEMRGKELDVEFHVVEVLKLEMPELTDEFLEELGDFENEGELRSFVNDSLARQADYRTQQAVRKLIVDLLTADVDFELPATLVRKQTNRELQRQIMELKRSGFDDEMVKRFVNASRQNAQASTEAALREHFVLEQIAEEQKIDAEESDYEDEIELIAQQEDAPARRVRARLEKQGQMDALRNQIVERKVIELIVEKAKVTEEKVDKKEGEDPTEFAVYHNALATKNDASIPEAKYADDSPMETQDKKKDDSGKVDEE
ncbi:Trigger factor [Rubripirellula obstinata]|uniref:Trigger factor n=1 Tax=Rubripirellula obstinata TaxID=406547 RepID=A0A5B1CBM3_9BACT|nr:trigger factor [Rubripirellula obstinata]KAA1257612.1 Trigger factor [Rubripirellula obstinata]